jgi:hypothetical protein
LNFPPGPEYTNERSAGVRCSGKRVSHIELVQLSLYQDRAVRLGTVGKCREQSTFYIL